ncbi:MAG: hypothetical protein ACREYC_20105 [Gammaproteobacteria bacterium]
MENDMVLRGMAARTRQSYLEAVRGLAKFYRRSPDAICNSDSGLLRYGCNSKSNVINRPVSAPF